MLARTIKSAAELGISDIEHESLLKVLDKLERGELVHAPEAYAQGGSRPEGDSFNMSAYVSVGGCGTVGCIAGWMHLVSGGACYKRFNFWTQKMLDDHAALFPNSTPHWSLSIIPDALNELFHAANVDVDLEDITPDQAAQAIRNYLSVGEPRWEEVLAQ